MNYYFWREKRGWSYSEPRIDIDATFMGSRATEPQVYMAWEWTSNALVPFLPFRLVNTWYQSSDVLQACPGKKCHSGVRTQQSSPFLNLTSRLHFLNFPPPLDSLPFMLFLFFFVFFSYFVHWFTVCSSVCVFFHMTHDAWNNSIHPLIDCLSYIICNVYNYCSRTLIMPPPL